MMRRHVPILVLLGSLASLNAAETYYLPQIANGQAGGLIIRTTFIFFNPANTLTIATANLRLTTDTNAPLVVTLPELGQGDKFDFSLIPGQTLMLQTDGADSLKSGAAVVTSSSKIGVSAIYSTYNGSQFLTEAGVGASAPSRAFVLPVDSQVDYDTGLAIYNTSGSPANLTMRLLDESGSEVATKSQTLAAGNRMVGFVTGEVFTQIDAHRGALLVESDRLVVALTLRQNWNPVSYTTLPVVPANSAQTAFMLPQIANGILGSYAMKSTFILFNLSQQNNAAVTVKLTKGDGTPFRVTVPGKFYDLSTFTINLSPGGSAFLTTNGAEELVTGAASLTSTVPVGVCAVFNLSDTGGHFITEAGVGDSPVLTAFTLPVDMQAGSDTGVAFANASTGAVTATVTLYDLSGIPMAPDVSVTLVPGGHDARFVSELFPGKAPLRGSLVIKAPTAISGIALRQNGSPIVYTTLPVASGAYVGPLYQQPLLPQEVTGVKFDADKQMNFQLASASLLTGVISNPIVASPTLTLASKFRAPVNIVARSDAGTTFLDWNGEWETGRYLIRLPAGRYTLTFCQDYHNWIDANDDTWTTTFTYSPPEPVEVSGHATRNFLLPTVPLHSVRGTVSGLAVLTALDYAEILFANADRTVECRATVNSSNAQYHCLLPDGEYTVGLEAAVISWDGEHAFYGFLEAGTLTVEGTDLTGRDFALPPFSTVQGKLSMPGMGDMSQFPVRSKDAVETWGSCCEPSGSSTYWAMKSGDYRLLVRKNHSHFFGAQIQVWDGALLDVPPPLAQPILINGDRTLNFASDSLPISYHFTGKVTDPTGQPVQSVGIDVIGSEIDGLAPRPGGKYSFDGYGVTDEAGDFLLQAPKGTNYLISLGAAVPKARPRYGQ